MMSNMPSAFDSGPLYGSSGNLLQGQPGSVPGQPGQPGQPMQAAPSSMDASAPLPTMEDVDMSIQCNPEFMQASVRKLLASQNAANATKLPLGIVCKPMHGDKGINNDQIEVVDFGSTGIVRCKRCRTYINPFVSWLDNGRRWRLVVALLKLIDLDS
jgi:protein transport protein SEC24